MQFPTQSFPSQSFPSQSFPTVVKTVFFFNPENILSLPLSVNVDDLESVIPKREQSRMNMQTFVGRVTPNAEVNISNLNKDIPIKRVDEVSFTTVDSLFQLHAL
jgi:hypothetical protein